MCSKHLQMVTAYYANQLTQNLSTDLPVGLDGLFEMQEGLDPQAVHGEESTASEGEY